MTNPARSIRRPIIAMDALLAATPASAPRSPRTDQPSYTIVNLHPGSTGHAGDPMSNVRATAKMLPPHPRVVTLDKLVMHLRRHFRSPIGQDRSASGDDG